MLVGICGDVHENGEFFREALQQMRSRGIRHFIGTGDYSSRPAADLERRLNLIKEMLPFASDSGQVFLVPGNWEHYAGISPVQANESLKAYGKLLCEACTEYGFVAVGGRRIVVSHFPQNVIPRQYLPSDAFIYRVLPNQPHQLETIQLASYSPKQTRVYGPSIWPGVDLCITAHTHKHGFWSLPGGLCEVNVGALTRRKEGDEPFSYGIYDTSSNEVSLIDVEKSDAYVKVDVGKVASSIPSADEIRGTREAIERFRRGVNPRR